MHTKTCIYGCGELNRIKLKQSDGYIYGFLSIKTSNNNIVSFNVYQSELTKSGKVNPAYKGLQTVLNEYKDSTTGTPDYVQISLNDKYPNADIQFKSGRVTKHLKFINRVEKSKSNMVFKIYGARVDSVDKNIIKCSCLTYCNKIYQFELYNDGKCNFEVGKLYDVVGHIVEGLNNGIPVDYLKIQRNRLSDLNINFESGIIDYEKSPF